MTAEAQQIDAAVVQPADSLERLVGNVDEFPILAKWNFFNHAGVSPLPRVAGDAFRKYSEQAEGGAYLGASWYADVEHLRHICAALKIAVPRPANGSSTVSPIKLNMRTSRDATSTGKGAGWSRVEAPGSCQTCWNQWR